MTVTHDNHARAMCEAAEALLDVLPQHLPPGVGKAAIRLAAWSAAFAALSDDSTVDCSCGVPAGSMGQS